MKTLRVRIEHSVQKDFDFWLAARGSGWSSLAPFTLRDEARSLSRAQRLGSGKVVRATVSQGRRGVLIIEAESREELNETDIEEIEGIMETCLGLEEDLVPFYSMLEAYPEFRWVAEIGAGRSIRSPTVFEDVVKTICTTNASWALTKGITRRLCEKLGDPFDGESHTFPTPKQMALTTEEFMRREIKSGYRSPYLVELARRIVDGDLDVEAWNSSPSDSANLKREVMGIKGVGNFASDNILKLLGRYDFLALDSWMRKRFSAVHGDGETVSDDEIEEFYAPFGGWRGLVMQLDMTKEYLIPRAR